MVSLRFPTLNIFLQGDRRDGRQSRNSDNVLHAEDCSMTGNRHNFKNIMLTYGPPQPHATQPPLQHRLELLVQAPQAGAAVDRDLEPPQRRSLPVR